MRFCPAHKIGLGFGLALIFLVVIASASVWTTVRLNNAARSAARALHAVNASNDLHERLEAAKSRMAAYLATGAAQHLASRRNGTEAVERAVAGIRDMDPGNPVLQLWIDEIESTLRRQAELRDRYIANRGARELTPSELLKWYQDEGYLLWQLHRAIDDKIEFVERARLADSVAGTRAFASAAMLINWLGGLMGFVLVSAAAIITIRDARARSLAEMQLEHQATHDALTGLPNRSLLRRRMEHSIATVEANGGSFALLLLDLDRFKEINDAFGHHIGDAVLQRLSPLLLAAVGRSDTVARLGGDEFGILLTAADKARAASVADAILATLEPPIVIDGQPLDIGVSIGIALYPDHGPDSTTLLKRADMAMYTAKRARAGQAVYGPDQAEYSSRSMTLAGELRLGIEHNQLLLHYQPKVDLKTMRVRGGEALVRWLHPREGLMSPGDFIPLAEHTGLIKPLGLWTLHTALLQCRAWHQGGMNLNIAVNLAPENLQDGPLFATVMDLLARSGTPPESLTVEVTESAMMADPIRMRTVLERLHDLGVQLSIDDFGTGYSSLAYLKDLPVDEVKVDRSFVKDVTANPRNACIVRAVIGLGHDLGLRVVAEGVEDRKTLSLLASWGCDLAQGYYFSRPLPPVDFMKWVTESTKGRPSFAWHAPTILNGLPATIGR